MEWVGGVGGILIFACQKSTPTLRVLCKKRRPPSGFVQKKVPPSNHPKYWNPKMTKITCFILFLAISESFEKSYFLEKCLGFCAKKGAPPPGFAQKTRPPSGFAQKKAPPQGFLLGVLCHWEPYVRLTYWSNPLQFYLSTGQKNLTWLLTDDISFLWFYVL